MDAQELKAKLEKKADERAAADWQKAKATQEAGELLALVKDTDEFSMQDAADILGVSRVMAYKILNGERAS